jgi:monofunctional biosynthetic peptidoglycan transglycosylase
VYRLRGHPARIPWGKRTFSEKGMAKRVFRFSVKLLLVLWIFTIIEVLFVRFVNPPVTTSVVYRWVYNKIYPTQPFVWPEQVWKPIHRISPHLIRSVQAGEDQKFVSHHGFDFEEMNRALDDLQTGRRMRGASTITMQTARTVFLWPSRSFLRKALEAYYTVVIESLWSKKRILEVYLNTVDWGTGIAGAEVAARKYFHTRASDLSRSQAALLAAILPYPHGWSPTKPSKYVRERQRRIMMDMDRMPVGRFRKR